MNVEGKDLLVSPAMVALPDEQFMHMADSAPVLLWIAGVDKECFYFNKQWLNYTGRTAEQEKGIGWTVGVHPDDYKEFIKLFEDAFDKREEFNMEYRLRRHDGQYRWILDNGKPRFSAAGRFEGFIGSCVEVHDLKELELHKDQFVVAVSHELKTPITSLKIYLQLLQQSLHKENNTENESLANAALAQVNKINVLTDHILDLFHMESQELSYNFEYFSLDELVRKIFKRKQVKFPEYNLKLNGSATSIIYGDVKRIEQVIVNIFSNSIKYSSPETNIVLTLSENNHSVSLCITDEGIGIQENELPNIFDRFYKNPDATAQTFPGLGIGLYLSKEIIKKQGGTIWATSKKNKETCFTIELPISASSS